MKQKRLWHYQARPDQLPPEDRDWRVFLMQAGRGFGKTRSAAEWIVEQAVANPGTKWAIIAPTWTEARKICYEGYSGILHAFRYDEVVSASARDLAVRLTNGSCIYGFGADHLERFSSIGGFTGAWLEEAQAFSKIGDVWPRVDSTVTGRIFITATPRGGYTADDLREARIVARDCALGVDGGFYKKGRLIRALAALHREREGDNHSLFRELASRADTVHVTGSTWDNAANLSANAVAELRKHYAGTPEVEGLVAA